MTEFIGFPRPDGSIGIRNHVILLGLGHSGGSISHRVAGLVKDIVPVFNDPEKGPPLGDILRHPNVAGIVVHYDGMDDEATAPLISDLERTGKPREVVDIRGFGPVEAVSKVTRSAIEIIRDVSTQRRELVRFSKLLSGLVHFSAHVMVDLLNGFVRLVMEENGRCLWVEKMTEGHSRASTFPEEKLAGDLKPGHQVGPDPGIYRYKGDTKIHSIRRAMLAVGVQIMVTPATSGVDLAHPLIPALYLDEDQEILNDHPHGPGPVLARDQRLNVENRGLLLLSEMLATASGKLTTKEILKDVIIAL